MNVKAQGKMLFMPNTRYRSSFGS